MNSDIKIILIHGNGGSTINDNWFPYVKTELEKLNLKVIANTFPDNVLARKEYWLPFLKDDLNADENTVIVGHSSGAVAAMRFAENNKILGSILIGACYTDLQDADEKASGYYEDSWNWEKIKKNQNWIAQFASTDDPYIPIQEARFIHENLNTEYYEFTNQGHFSWESNKKEFPEIIQIIKEKLNLN